MTFLQQFEQQFSLVTNGGKKKQRAEHIGRLQERIEAARKIRMRLKAQFDLGSSLRQAALWIAVERWVKLAFPQ